MHRKGGSAGTWRRSPSTADPRAASTGQAGFSLLEVVLALLLASTVVTGMAGGFLLLARTTATLDANQQLRVASANYAESLRTLNYLPCGTGTQYGTAYDTSTSTWKPPSGTTVTISVKYWSRQLAGGQGDYQAACPSPDQGNQLLAVTLSNADGRHEVQVVKVVP